MPSLDRGASGAAYWRSLDELADTPEFRAFVEKEFASYAPELLTSPTRRQFLKVMGASLALAGAGGLVGCRWPKETILPFAKNPAGRIPGVPVKYATAMDLGGAATGLLVSSYDGRPIKIEGNPDHPASRGATDGLTQAAILEMYDPDRSTGPAQRNGDALEPRDAAQFAAFARPHFDGLKARGGEGLAVLAEPGSSPTLADVRARFLAAFPKARWFEYAAISRDNQREGTRLAFGQPHRVHPRFDLEHAHVIVSLDSDFLMAHPTGVADTRDFARHRGGKDGEMSRLFVIESAYTITGSNADERHQARPSDIPIIAAKLAAALVKAGVALPETLGLAGKLAAYESHACAAPYVDAIAAQLKAHAGHSLIVAGLRQPPEVHALVAVLNEALGNAGKTVTYTLETDAERQPHAAALAALSAELGGGKVDTLLILGGNPAYAAPGDLKFAEAIGKAKTSIHLGLYADETAARCAWHVNAAHFLESWSDARGFDGTYSVVQPLIEPLFGGMTAAQLLAMTYNDEAAAPYDLVRRTFKAQFAASGDMEEAWRQTLHDGLLRNTAFAAASPTVTSGDWEARLSARAAAWKAPAAGGLEVAFAPDYRVYDGRFANNGWLQELPDPMTKLVWDNAALLSPATARQLGVVDGEWLTISAGGASVRIMALVQPGHAAGVATLALGGGRQRGGRVAEGAGVDVSPLRRSDAFDWLEGATAQKAGGSKKFARTQDHHAIRSEIGDWGKQERLPQLVREVSFEEFKKHPDAIKHVVHLPLMESLFSEVKYDGYKWGMAIDLTKCTGCSACVVACQAENNVPVVGRDEVWRGREMHWIRIDRYFRGSPDDPQVSHQPVACQHCENAPCETVCPVAATVHDSDGLNVMVYNRCIGTRYCGNNCPYKVRRFNWFFNHHGPAHPRSAASTAFTPPGKLRQEYLTELEKMAMNPKVTVRSRGVMEKCTFCTQRINEAKIEHRNAQVQGETPGDAKIPDGSLRTACQQACPADAIMFGDLNDPASAIAAWHKHNRAYFLLEEQNNQPRLKYLARLRNPIAGGASDDHGQPHGASHAAAETHTG